MIAKWMKRLPFDLGRLRHMSVLLLLITAVLMSIGVAFVYSANSTRESYYLQNLYRSHAQMALVGMVCIVLISYINYRVLYRMAWVLYLGGIVLLVAVLLIGEARMGARRWIFGIQPSEIAKLASIILLAKIMGRENARRDVWEFLAAVGIVAPPVLMILKQPDLGTAMMFIPVLMLMLFASGTALRAWLATVVLMFLLIGGVLGAVMLQESPSTSPPVRAASAKMTSFLGEYQRGRLVDALYPDRDPLNLGWNRRQSLIAIGSGGIWGKGFLKGDQNILGYLPQQVSANDFIFSVLAEEKGFAGAVIVLLLYLGVILIALKAALFCRDGFGRMLCVGVAALFFGHVFVNISMTIGLLPVTGLPLPFLSYGRTFMLTAVLAVGFVQSVLVHTPRTQPTGM